MFKRREREPEPQPGPSPPQEEAVLRDDLGVYPLWYLEKRLKEELSRASRTGGVFSLACWQLKLLPGEQPSAALLAQAATLIMEAVRTYDIVARIDEQRFTGLLLDAQYEAASTVAFRIKGDLQVRLPSAGRWQAGVASFPRDAVDADGLIQAAFRRLTDDARAA